DTPPVQVQTTADNSVCNFSAINDYNGSITLETTDASGLSDYTYAWYQGQSTNASNQINNNKVTTADISVDGILNQIPSGTYTVVITDPTSGCTLTIEQEIENDFTDLPVINTSTVDNVDVCSGNAGYPNGTISLTSVTGGSGSYEYEWYYGTSVNSAKRLDDDDDIFTQRAIAGTASIDVSGSATTSITGLNPGNYAVRVYDADRGCYSAVSTFNIIQSPNGLTVTPTVDQDNYTCDATNPTGGATATGAGATTPRYEWYKGSSAAGTVISTDASISDKVHGIYTVKYIDDATNCFVTAQVTIDEYDPTLTISASSTDQTNCDPNGTATLDDADITFSPAGPPEGFTGDGTLAGSGTFDIQWYYGPGTGSPMSNSTDPGNGSDPSGVTSATLTGLAAGQYTVVVTETQSGCVSSTETVTVGDDVTANAPDLEFRVEALPSECSGTGIFQVRMATNPTGSTFDVEFYEGAQDFASLNSLGDGLVTNDELVSNPGTPITVTNTASSAVGGAADYADNELADVLSGVYTVVVTDQATGCRYQEVYNLSYAGQQTTTTITVENVDQCPDNGVARVGLADNIIVEVNTQTGTFDDKESFTTDNGAAGVINAGGSTGTIQVTLSSGSLNNGDLITGTTSTAFATITSFTDGYQDGDFDDISEYILYLYAGSGIPANRTAAYTYEGARFPITYNAQSGEVRDGDGALLRTESTLNLDDEAVFTDLPAGPYIAVAREKANPAWSPGTTFECWSEASLDEQILDLAYEPIIDDFTITANTNCDVSGVGGNGQLAITVIEDPNEGTNPAENQQPAGFRFTWVRDSDSNTILQEEIFTDPATSDTDADLVPGDYTVTIERALETLDITYTLTSGSFNEGERITFSGGANGVIISDDGSTINAYITTGTVAN
ncbi:MAG: hypothetical protein RJQ14_09510, partial [Marinoscillum sp.]